MKVNSKLTFALVFGGAMALAGSLQALTSAATGNTSSTSDGASDNSNPYAVIVDRNIFRLNPVPPPPPPVDTKPKELPKVYLSGIIKIGEDVRVLFSIPGKDAKTSTQYFKLASGEKDGDLELVNIHPDQQAVDVVVSGTAMTLTMASNTLASAGAKPAAQPGPGMRPGPGAPVPPPAPVTAAAPGGSSAIIVGGGERDSSRAGVSVAGGGGGITTIGGGNSTSFGGGSGVAVSGGGGGGGTSFGGGSGVTISGGGTGAFGNGTGVNNVGNQITTALTSGSGTTQVGNLATGSQVSPEQQYVNNLIYSQKYPNAPPMPTPPRATK